jgi:hypothetical protein
MAVAVCTSNNLTVGTNVVYCICRIVLQARVAGRKKLPFSAMIYLWEPR